MHKASKCYELYVEGKNAGFCAILHFPHPKRSYYKVSRLVILPDYQGLGLGEIFINEIAKLSIKPFAITTSQIAIIKSLAKSEAWALTRNTRNARNTGYLAEALNKTLSSKRITYTFVYKKSMIKVKK